jgi:DNA-binding GntR family transcriptional regulator
MWLMRSNIDLMAAQEAHWKIIDALERGDGNRAGKLLQEHIFNFPASTSFPVTRIDKTLQQD